MKLFSKRVMNTAIISMAVLALVASTVSYADYYGNIQSFTGATINGSTNLPTGWASASGSDRKSEYVSGLYGKSVDNKILKLSSIATSGGWANPPVYANRILANIKSDGTLNQSETLISGSYYHFTAEVAASDMDFYHLGLYAHRVKVRYTPKGGAATESGELVADGAILGFYQEERGTVKLKAWGEDITPSGFEFKARTWYKLDVIFNGITNTMDTYLNGEFVKTVDFTDNIAAAAIYNNAAAYDGWYIYLLKYIGVIYDRYNGTAAGSSALFDNVGFGNYYYGAAKPVITAPTPDLSVNGKAVSGNAVTLPSGAKVSEAKSLIQSSHSVVFIDFEGNIKGEDDLLFADDRIVEQMDGEKVFKYYEIKFFDAAAANGKVTELNEKATKNEFKTDLAASQEVLGVEIESANLDSISDFLYNNKPYSSYDEFISYFNIGNLYIKISTGTLATAKELLENNHIALEIDFGAYSALSDEGKSILVSKLLGVDYSENSFADVYEKAYLLALFKSADSYEDIKIALENHETEYGIQISKANACSNPLGVYKKLFAQKSSANELSDIADLYDAAVTAEVVSELSKSSRVFEINGNAYGTQMILVLKDGQSLSDISNENPPAYIRPFATEGKYSEKIQISESAGIGYYTVYADKNAVTKEVFVPDIATADSYVETNINSSANATALKNHILNAENTLGIRTSKFSEYADILSELLFAKKPFADYKDFRQKFDELEILAKLKTKNSEIAKDEILNNADLLGIDIENTYDKLTDSGKAILLSELKKGNYAGQSFADVYKKCFLLAAFRGADYYATIQSFFTQYAGDYGINLADANVCKNISGVYQILMNKRNSATNISEIPSLFADAIREELAEEAKSVIVNGGSGGGGGSSGGSFVIPNDNTDANNSTNTTKFSDMSNYSWASSAVKYLSDRNIISGVEPTKFEPGRNVTRAEFCKLIATLFGLDGEQISFSDVSQDAWYGAYIAACNKNGIISGDGQNFYPENSIKREDAASIIYRVLDGKDFGFLAEKTFIDGNQISDYAQESVKKLSSIGIISGNENGEFLPKQFLTRAEAAVLIYKVAKMIE